MIPFSPLQWVCITLAVLLAGSVAGNAYLGNEYLAKRDEAVALGKDVEHAQGVATQCSAGVDKLAAAATSTALAASAAAAAARSAAFQNQSLADLILASPAAVPGDDCKSAAARAADYMRRRARP